VDGGTTAKRLDGLGAARAIIPLGPQVWVGGDGGLFVSYDFGETWEQRSTTAGIRSLLFSRWPQSDLTAFAGTASGLLKSADLGRTLKPTALAGAPVSRMDWPGPALLLATGYGLVLSDDGGRTFTGAGESLPRGEMKAFVLSAFFAVDPVIFAAPASGGVYRSGDGGKTWTSAGLAGETVCGRLSDAAGGAGHEYDHRLPWGCWLVAHGSLPECRGALQAHRSRCRPASLSDRHSHDRQPNQGASRADRGPGRLASQA